LPPAYAIKCLRPELEHEARAVAFLAREAAVAQSVKNRRIIPVFASQLDRPPYFLVMPLLEGQDLASYLGRMGRLSIPQALWIARQTAEGLAALHSQGWMHGDVKPSNIFLSPLGQATLLDLGFARRLDPPEPTNASWLLGTLTYMAPEKITSTLRADIRSDLYSLGVIFYEMLAGRPPFTHAQPGDLARAHLQEVPPEITRFRPYIPRRLVALLRRLLAKDPLRRPQTPEELVERLVDLEIATFDTRDPQPCSGN